MTPVWMTPGNPDNMSTMPKENAETIEKELLQEISTLLSTAPASLDPEKPLHELGIDSLGFVEILIFIEKRFKLKLIDTGLNRESFRTIRALAQCTSQELEKLP